MEKDWTIKMAEELGKKKADLWTAKHTLESVRKVCKAIIAEYEQQISEMNDFNQIIEVLEKKAAIYKIKYRILDQVEEELDFLGEDE